MTEQTTGPEHAENVARAGGRVYTDPVTNKKYPSVTTILNDTSSKHGLIDWAARKAAEYAYDHTDAWRAVAASMATPELGRDAAVTLISKAHDRYRDAKGDLGSMVHAIVEALVLDKSLPVVEPGTQAAGMLDAFLEWVTDYDVTFFMAELTVANNTHGYAGTLDAGVHLGAVTNEDGEPRSVVIDIKTGSSIFPADVLAQLVAYEHAEEVWLPMGGKDTLPDVDSIAVLHLKCDENTGEWSYDFREIAEDKASNAEHWDAFVKRCADYHAQRSIGASKYLLRRVRRDRDPWYIADLPSLARCAGPLAKVGLTTLEEVGEFGVDKLLMLDGIGVKSIQAIRAAQVACRLVSD